jgi:hypothetical protein
VKFRKLITPVAGATHLGRIRFLDDGVRQHRGARGDSGDESDAVRREYIRAAVENPREAGEQHYTAHDDHGLAPTDTVGDEA